MTCTGTRDRGGERKEEIQRVSRCFDEDRKSVKRRIER